MTIYVFGNPDELSDNRPFEIIKHVQIPNISFKVIPPHADLPEQDNLVILDTVFGIEKVTLIKESDIDKINISPRNTVHDFDLGFQLKYLMKIGKLRNFTIVGIPQEGDIDYDSIQETFKKLVAQDIQGS